MQQVFGYRTLSHVFHKLDVAVAVVTLSLLRLGRAHGEVIKEHIHRCALRLGGNCDADLARLEVVIRRFHHLLSIHIEGKLIARTIRTQVI